NNWVMSCYDNPKYKKAIRSWANVIRAYRNKIAHHSRIYAFKVTDAPTIIKNDSKSYFPENNLKETQKLYLYGG
ncbi:TPA: Abi family protein, partial [Enterococcus faecium]|nr:Abi family protein [Enterococcus faecium]